MAHEITSTDNMFSYNEIPWHGLGQVLDHYPTMDEAYETAFGWEPVEETIFRRVPIVTAEGELVEEFQEYTGDKLAGPRWMESFYFMLSQVRYPNGENHLFPELKDDPILDDIYSIPDDEWQGYYEGVDEYLAEMSEIYGVIFFVEDGNLWSCAEWGA